MSLVKSALNLKQRPSSHILHLKNPWGSWSRADHELAVAYQYLQDESCPQCGKPMWICRSGNNMLTFSVQSDVCRATAALEKKNKKAKPGESFYAVPTMRKGVPMPTRDDYYRELAEEAAIHAKNKR